MKVHFFMISMRPFMHFSGLQQILQTFTHVWRPDPAEEISSFSSPPTSEGVAKSSSFCELHKRKVAQKPIHFVSHKRSQGKHMNKQRNSSRTYEHNDLKNNAHIHSPQLYPAKQRGQHDDDHMRTLILLRNLIHVRNLVRMRTWIHMKNLVHMKNLIWGSYSSQVVS